MKTMKIYWVLISLIFAVIISFAHCQYDSPVVYAGNTTEDTSEVNTEAEPESIKPLVTGDWTDGAGAHFAIKRSRVTAAYEIDGQTVFFNGAYTLDGVVFSAVFEKPDGLPDGFEAWSDFLKKLAANGARSVTGDETLRVEDNIGLFPQYDGEQYYLTMSLYPLDGKLVASYYGKTYLLYRAVSTPIVIDDDPEEGDPSVEPEPPDSGIDGEEPPVQPPVEPPAEPPAGNTPDGQDSGRSGSRRATALPDGEYADKYGTTITIDGNNIAFSHYYIPGKTQSGSYALDNGKLVILINESDLEASDLEALSFLSYVGIPMFMNEQTVPFTQTFTYTLVGGSIVVNGDYIFTLDNSLDTSIYQKLQGTWVKDGVPEWELNNYAPLVFDSFYLTVGDWTPERFYVFGDQIFSTTSYYPLHYKMYGDDMLLIDIRHQGLSYLYFREGYEYKGHEGLSGAWVCDELNYQHPYYGDDINLIALYFYDNGEIDINVYGDDHGIYFNGSIFVQNGTMIIVPHGELVDAPFDYRFYFEGGSFYTEEAPFIFDGETLIINGFRFHRDDDLYNELFPPPAP